MEYVGRVPDPLDRFIDDIYCLSGTPRYRRLNVPPMPSAHLMIKLGGPVRLYESHPAAALLCRRNAAALAFSALALFAAGVAVPGDASARALLIGPLVAVVAALFVVWARSLARKLDGYAERVDRAPLVDLLAIFHRPDNENRGRESITGSIGLHAATVVVATLAAFGWDRLDHGTYGSSFAAAGSRRC